MKHEDHCPPTDTPVLRSVPRWPENRGVKPRESLQVSPSVDLAQRLRPCFGPRGLAKSLLFRYPYGFSKRPVCSPDTASVLSHMTLRDPQENTLAFAATAQAMECGDGTGLVLLLASSLLRQARELLALGVTGAEIQAGYRLGCCKALALLEQGVCGRLEEPREEQQVRAILRPFLASWQPGFDSLLEAVVARCCVFSWTPITSGDRGQVWEGVTFDPGCVRVCTVLEREPPTPVLRTNSGEAGEETEGEGKEGGTEGEEETEETETQTIEKEVQGMGKEGREAQEEKIEKKEKDIEEEPEEQDVVLNTNEEGGQVGKEKKIVEQGVKTENRENDIGKEEDQEENKVERKNGREHQPLMTETEKKDSEEINIASREEDHKVKEEDYEETSVEEAGWVMVEETKKTDTNNERAIPEEELEREEKAHSKRGTGRSLREERGKKKHSTGWGDKEEEAKMATASNNTRGEKAEKREKNGDWEIEEADDWVNLGLEIWETAGHGENENRLEWGGEGTARAGGTDAAEIETADRDSLPVNVHGRLHKLKHHMSSERRMYKHIALVHSAQSRRRLHRPQGQLTKGSLAQYSPTKLQRSPRKNQLSGRRTLPNNPALTLPLTASVVVEEPQDDEARSKVTVTLRSSDQALLDSAQAAVAASLRLYRSLLSDPRLVPGCGAAEVALAVGLTQEGLGLVGMEQLAVHAFSQALLEPAKALGENAGTPADLAVLRLYGRHWVGKGEGAYEWWLTQKRGEGPGQGVVDGLGCKARAIQRGTEASLSILCDLLSQAVEEEDKTQVHFPVPKAEESAAGTQRLSPPPCLMDIVDYLDLFD